MSTNKKQMKLTTLLMTLFLGVMLSASQCEDVVPEDDPPPSDEDTPDTPSDTGIATEINPDDGDSTEPVVGNTDDDIVDDTDDDPAPSTGYDGLDLLVVVDNSGSMAEEQQILATGMFSLVNQMINPVQILSTPPMETPAIEDMRVAVATSDLGLQWGDGNTGGNTTDVVGCSASADDDTFLGVKVDAIDVKSGVIRCDIGGGQCPEGFECIDSLCQGNAAVVEVLCPEADQWVETTPASSAEFATQAACMAMQGTEGCGIEQQLESAVYGLEENPDFLVPNHKLAVLMVSDEEDCSIESADLFQTEEWQSGASGMLNVACNYPESNNDYLFETGEYRERLASLKGGDADAVLFGAIVGVPAGADSACQGNGEEIAQAGCLGLEEMELLPTEFTLNTLGQSQHYTHFETACTRSNGNQEVTTARPGRRFVEVAQTFGQNGMVSSICNEDWSQSLEAFANMAMDGMAQ